MCWVCLSNQTHLSHLHLNRSSLNLNFRHVVFGVLDSFIIKYNNQSNYIFAVWLNTSTLLIVRIAFLHTIFVGSLFIHLWCTAQESNCLRFSITIPTNYTSHRSFVLQIWDFLLHSIMLGFFICTHNQSNKWLIVWSLQNDKSSK